MNIQVSHPETFCELLAKEEELKIAEAEKAKQKKSTTVKSKKAAVVYYKRDSPEYKAITRSLAAFVGGTNTPNRIVEDAKFKLLGDNQSCLPCTK